MKERISATVEPSTIKIIEELVKKGVYRNQSHVIEVAITHLKEVRHDKHK